MKAVEVREQLVNAVLIDLVGPVSGLAAGSHLENEVLPATTTPSRWYLTGFLVPFESKLADKTEETSAEQIDLIPNRTGVDDEAAPEATSSRKTPFPSSIGLSVLVPQGTKSITATVTWGDYKRVDNDSLSGWQREPKWSHADIFIPPAKAREALPYSDGLEIETAIRRIPNRHGNLDLIPEGTIAVSVFVINNRPPQDIHSRDAAYAFQVKLQLEADQPFVPRPNLRGYLLDDFDERLADLQYRDAMEFAVGHGVSAHAHVDSDGVCHSVESVWIPRSEVERVEPARRDGVELSMDSLAVLTNGAEANRIIGKLITQYREWLTKQDIPLDPRRKQVAEMLITRGNAIAGRIEAGMAALDDPQVLEAFCIANRVMAAAARKRNPSQPEPAWFPFQLAFLLVNLPGIVDPVHPDREMVDLLFFPTGGGKTEAYLGLAAFTMVLRRLRNPGVAGAGVTVIMRYT
ncbi:MAG: hypothetical protein JST16_00710, partial [Bdellovibrionales bacterium]|nr:hypothetical protein [Bdellovibrionales bacterium]